MKVENKYGFDLDVFLQAADDGDFVTLRSNSGPASIFFWFTPGQVKALAAQLQDLAVQCKDESSQNL